MLPPCRVRAWRTLPMAPILSTDLTRVFRGTVVVSITRAVTREPVAIFVIRKTPVRPMTTSVGVRALSAHRWRCRRFRADSSCVLWGTCVVSVTCALAGVPMTVFVIYKLGVGLILLSIRRRARSTLRRDVTHSPGGAAPRTSVALTFTVVLNTVLHPLIAFTMPVCGAVVGTGRALVGPVTADIGHLLVTVMTPITGTLTVKHVTLIVNYSKFCVWGIVLSLHVTFSARGLRPWSGCGGVRVIVTDILP